MSARERIAQDARLTPEVGTERRSEYRPAERGEGDASGDGHPPPHTTWRGVKTIPGTQGLTRQPAYAKHGGTRSTRSASESGGWEKHD